MTRSPAVTANRLPAVTVDAVVLRFHAAPRGRACCDVLLIERGAEPFRGDWAFPGGFVEYGEEPGAAVRREVEEETGLACLPLRQFQVYGDPKRDPRGHTVTIVYVAELSGEGPSPVPRAGDDAARAAWFPVDALPELAFDHRAILDDVLETRGER